MASYSLWRDERDYFINWNWPVFQIKRFVDSVGDPYRGAKTIFKKEEITIMKVEILPDLNIRNRDVGKIFKLVKGKPIIVCKDGLLLIESAKYRNTNKTIFPLISLKERFY